MNDILRKWVILNENLHWYDVHWTYEWDNRHHNFLYNNALDFWKKIEHLKIRWIIGKVKFSSNSAKKSYESYDMTYLSILDTETASFNLVSTNLRFCEIATHASLKTRRWAFIFYVTFGSHLKIVLPIRNFGCFPECFASSTPYS